jgi:hypothetical protein
MLALWCDPRISRHECARRMGYPLSTLYVWARIMGLPARMPRIHDRREPMSFATACQVMRLRRNGASLGEIGEAVGLSAQRVREFLLELDPAWVAAREAA